MITWFEARLDALRASMTPGQRWTALLAVLYAIAVLNYGGPSSTVLVGAPSRTAAPSRERVAARPTTATPAPVAPYSIVAGYAEGFSAETPEEASIEANGEQDAAAPPRIVLAARAAEPTGGPSRDDEAMARAFLAAASFDAPVITVGSDTDATCKQVVASGNVVAASEGLGPLRTCLVEAGVTVIAFDQDGSQPGGPGLGQVFSSRRSVEDSIVDLGRWGVSASTLEGKVGLVGSMATRAEVERAAGRLKSTGVDVVAQAFVDDDATAAGQTSAAALDFSANGVETVLFAVSVAQQRNWVAQYRVLAPAARYVVSDASDGVRNETYPAFFDGAVAHTSLRIPWFSRDHSETPLQAACRQRWETAAGGPIRPTEITRVFAWCQHIALVDAALVASGDGSFAERLRGVALPSPLTSDLGSLEDGGWGPMSDAVLVWRATCGCWTEQQPFKRRAA